MDLTKRKPVKDDSSVRAYFLREGIEVCLVLVGLAVAEWIARVPLWLWFMLPAGKLLVSILFYLFFVKKILRKSARNGLQSLVGRNALTLVPLEPVGQIRIGSEIWAARGRNHETIASGQRVTVCGVSGKLLLIEEAQRET